ncbi:hypothetical protein LTR17_001278 [Elasticomyces elasticus]|nr:hypothetical protein LTR17_001278 [Elasticomyces elasticus]
MATFNTSEMQYTSAAPMQLNNQASPSDAAPTHEHTSECESQAPKKERTFLGMRGGGIIREFDMGWICAGQYSDDG